MARSYKEIRAQIAELEKEAEQARKAEMSGAREQILNIMREFNLSPADISKLPTQAAKGLAKTTVPAVYRNTETGETWTGRGRAPGWIKDQDREKFRIDVSGQLKYQLV